MTEEEAKDRWCPFARGYGFPAITHNRETDGGPSAACLCIGSACMAWRWDSKRNPNWKPDTFGAMSFPQPHPEDKPPMYINSDTSGHCGLAGKP